MAKQSICKPEEAQNLPAFRLAVGKEGKSAFYLFPSLCKGCGLCIAKCPTKALAFGKELGVYGTPVALPEAQKCTACGFCQTFCPDCAIRVDR